MLKNYFLVSWRNLMRNKLHTVINVTSLTIGITASLVIALLVQFEYSFNRGFEGYTEIYRIHSKFSSSFAALNRGIPTGAVPYLRENFTGINHVTQFHCLQTNVIIPTDQNNKVFESQNNIIITDPDYFAVFTDYEWIVGSPERLTEPFTVVLTESKARNYFGKADESILGKEIIYKDSLHTTVAGIIKDLPFRNDFYFTDFISLSTIEKSFLKENIQPDDWSSINSSSQAFFRVSNEITQDKIEAQIPALIEVSKEKSTWDNLNKFQVQPLSTLHFDIETGIFDYSRSPTHLPTLGILLLVAALLLTIGIINFVNLVTARAIRRAKEVGIRKVLGSTRSKLMTQFIGESFVITLFAVLLAIPLTELSLQFFDEFIPQGVGIEPTITPMVLITLLVLVSITAGAYPAFVLSAYNPVTALKNQNNAGTYSGPAFLRKALIVFQFTFAQILIIGTVIVSWQLRYMLNKDLGFSKDAIVYLYAPWHLPQQKVHVLKDELTKLSGVEKVSLSTSPATERGWNSTTITYNTENEVKKISVFNKHGDDAYLSLYNIKILAGRNVSPSDTIKEILINQTLMHEMGFKNPSDVIGQFVEFNKTSIPVIGVVEDFHFQSLHAKVQPVIIGNRLNSFYCVNVKLSDAKTQDLKQTMAKLNESLKKIYPDEKIAFEFMDETIKSFYENEKQTTKLVNTATALAILISGLGLFGLASYTATQRTKEIGIRKVLGASVKNIVMLLSKDFMLLVTLAFLLAMPLAWLAGKHWLENYPYHIEIKIWVFALTALVSTSIALLTVGYQTLKAAQSNPTESLRSE